MCGVSGTGGEERRKTREKGEEAEKTGERAWCTVSTAQTKQCCPDKYKRH